MKFLKDLSNNTYNLITEEYYVLVFKDIINTIEFLGFLSNREYEEFTLCNSEVITIFESWISCNQPDPWTNKYWVKGKDPIGWAPDIAKFLVKELSKLIVE